MHLLESYSLQSGQKINKIDIYPKYYPLPYKKYITCQFFSKDSKNYEHFPFVLQLLHPILEKAGIKIVQIGGAGEPTLPTCHNVAGKTSIGQAAYLIKNSLLHFGVDSFGGHVAAAFDVPHVILTSNNYSKNVRPYFGSADKQIILEPDLKGDKPSFSFQEQPKTINTIKPEDIVAAVCKLLKLDFNFPYETLFVGFFNKFQSIEIVPNQVAQINNMQLPGVGIRMDLHFNEECLVEQLKLNKGTIVTSRPINPQILAGLRGRINEVIYELDNNHNPAFCKFMWENGVPFRLISKLPEDVVNELKFYYYDYALINHKKPNIPDELKDKTNLYYRTSKFTLGNGKIYPSIYALKENRPVKDLNDNFNKVDLDSKYIDDFWLEVDNMHVLRAK